MKYFAGLDIGSRNTKMVIWNNSTRQISASGYLATGTDPLKTVKDLFRQIYRGIDLTPTDIGHVYTTGYGRHLYKPATKTVTEISAHATGVRFIFPQCRTIIDIGGQDAKIIGLDNQGRVSDFVMNDKCAAGTGRFLELTAIRLNCFCDTLSDLALKKITDLSLPSTCVVFAESEIINLIAAGEQAPNIAHAVHKSIARRITTQMAALEVHDPIVFTGGVALNTDLLHCLEKELNTPILRPPDPEITGALGAAIMAAHEQD